MVRGPRSQSDVEKLRKAQNRIIEWASNEIGFIYQLHALSELKKPIEPLHLDSAAYLSEALLLEISYFLVAATLYGGRSKPYEDFKEKIGDFCRRFAELRDSHQVETIVIELTRRADELAAIQSELPTAYVLLSDSPIARKYLAAFSPHQSVSARFDHRSIPSVLKETVWNLLQTCSKRIVKAHDAAGDRWDQMEHFRSVSAIVLDVLAQSFRSPETIRRIDKALNALAIVKTI